MRGNDNYLAVTYLMDGAPGYRDIIVKRETVLQNVDCTGKKFIVVSDGMNVYTCVLDYT